MYMIYMYTGIANARRRAQPTTVLVHKENRSGLAECIEATGKLNSWHDAMKSTLIPSLILPIDFS